jgi:superfamily II DNA or RNA helicase
MTARLGFEEEVEDPAAWAAGIEYLSTRVQDPDTPLGPIADSYGIPPWRAMRCLGAIRDASEYRAYVGEWIREGCPTFVEQPEPAVEVVSPEVEEPPPFEVVESAPEDGEVCESLEPELLDQDAPPVPSDLRAASAAEGLPSRWIAPFAPYDWQIAAGRAWEGNQGRGIMQVVTGAGKTALALYLYARLLDRSEQSGHEIQAIVVVPRIELARQWARECRRLLKLEGLRLGQYHSELKCRPENQDVLIITQDSARRELPKLRLDRPVLLIADECHRLGAPAASRLLGRNFSWTLGLSATPERGGDFGFEQILVPRLGPIVWKYGYKEAVRDGIIARYSVARVKVHFTVDEAAAYEDLTEKVKRLLDGLKGHYPVLYRAPPERFWQVMGDLKQRHPDDERFEMLTAASSERRVIVHFAHQKYEVVNRLAREVGPPRKVLCFHERIEAADRLCAVCASAGRSAAVYHSQIPEPTRASNLERFRQGRADWLIACKSLDEGLDIPAVDTIVIVAGSKAPRQLIQRLGRALRRKGEDRTATVVLVEVAGVDDALLEHEGLAELREAAEDVVEMDAGDLTAWLRSRPQAAPETALISPSAVEKVAPAARARRWIEHVRNLGTTIRRRFSGGSWTGTPGNRSYYDKDSSPD